MIDENNFGGAIGRFAESISGNDRLNDSEYDYYLGRAIGDIISGIVGAGISAAGVAEIIGSIAAGGTITIGSGGTLAVGGLTVTSVGVAEGTLLATYGGSVMMISAGNLNNDLSKAQKIRKSLNESNKNLKKLDDSHLKKNGIDPHDFKKDILKETNVKDKNVAHYNIFRNSETKELFLVPNSNNPAISTGVYLKK